MATSLIPDPNDPTKVKEVITNASKEEGSAVPAGTNGPQEEGRQEGSGQEGTAVQEEVTQRVAMEQGWGTHVPSAPPFILDPKDEFESVLIDLVSFQRKKRLQYGSEMDFLQNFYMIAEEVGITPLRASHVLFAKHNSTLRKWFGDHDQEMIRDRQVGNHAGVTDPTPNPNSDDAYMDRAVYAILQLCLYRRGPIQ